MAEESGSFGVFAGDMLGCFGCGNTRLGYYYVPSIVVFPLDASDYWRRRHVCEVFFFYMAVLFLWRESKNAVGNMAP